jgi:hypothetical protein
MYDTRLGRWMSRDALENKYPFLTPYNFVANSPLQFIDPDGNEIIVPREMRVRTKRFIQQELNTYIERAGSYSSIELSVTNSGVINVPNEKDIKRMQKYIIKNINSKNFDKRNLATFYQLIIDKKTILNLEATPDQIADYQSGNNNDKNGLIKNLGEKLWSGKIFSKINEINPAPVDLKKHDNEEVQRKNKSELKKEDGISTATGAKVDENGKVETPKKSKWKFWKK